ncbi:hypothetical protein [Campylobacter concisus]|uniref:hypothetical protein n=1 Tax=Campylobacter concisus TaxID=199 RepID=UPI001F54C863|nr:hypothetical protein [Campylobacter concisus]
MFKKILLLAFLLVSLQARVVLDSDDKKVEVPDVIERATPLIGAFVQVSAMLGNEDQCAKTACAHVKNFPKNKEQQQ